MNTESGVCIYSIEYFTYYVLSLPKALYIDIARD